MPAISMELERGFDLVGGPPMLGGRWLPADCLRGSSIRLWSFSLPEKNCFIISARTVGEASLIDLPLMMVTLAVSAPPNSA
jgi:hypothetical protein